jgi:D-serine deaminase-like pyridoxal phosphate-dependent protein
MAAPAPTNDWMRIANEDDVPSPALLIHPGRIEENLRRMIARAGGPDRLRPHVKTHKLPQVVALELAHGIRKFKAATIAEAEMCAMAGAPDVLLAYQPVGPNVRRFVALVRKYPKTKFACLADTPAVVAALGAAASAASVVLNVLIDLNVGMNRTGIAPGPEADALYRRIAATAGLRPGGIHAYDGHLRNHGYEALVREANEGFRAVWALRDDLTASGILVPAVVAGGSRTFSVHAADGMTELGAGTSVLWDASDAAACPDVDFVHAAVLLTRVVSHPAPGLLCLDLGHKSVASEMPHPRVALFGLEDAVVVNHSEEHLVLKTSRAGGLPVGTALYGIPTHVCPTVALHGEVFVVRGGRTTETWPVAARARRLTI